MERFSRNKRFCKDCGGDISDLAKNAQRCPLCNDVHRIEYMKECHRMQHKKENMLGTSSFSAHRNPNFDKEKIEILIEKKKLGLC